jgi:phytoene desaturase (3,4-didehydrolycopene-forming)
LADIGKRLGANYHLAGPVKGIAISSDKKALGVSLATNEIIEADAVVVNADLLYAYKELLPSYNSKPTVSRKKEDVSCSAITFYWSLSEKVPQLESHNMFVGQPSGHEFPDVYRKRDRLSRPSFYVHVPSRTDPSAAPEGKDTVMVLILVDNIDSSKTAKENDIDGLVADTREYILSSIEKRTRIVDLKALIEHETFHSPPTWQEMFNSDRGSVFGLNHNFFNILAFRPHIKHDLIDGVYFVGASTHPGAGVPTCLSGAKLTAERILQDLEIPISWQNESSYGKKDLGKTTASSFWRAWPRIALLGVLLLLIARWCV